MNYILLPSLKNAAAIKTASILYNECELRKMFEENKDIDFACDWVIIEKKIDDKLSQILPSSLRKLVSKLIRPMDFEVEEWKRNHEFLLEHLGGCSCTWLVWKTDGTINRSETAKKIIASENIDPKIRFVLACTYFLEDEVLALWEIINKVGKKKNINTFNEIHCVNNAVRLWLIWLKKRDKMKLKKKGVRHWREKIDEFFRKPRYDAGPGDIPLRISCFYPFLSREMRQKYIQFLGRPSSHSDDFQVCVNKMDETDRIEAFKYKYPLGLMFCLTWPYRSIFIKLAKEVFCYLAVDGFKTVLNFILSSYIFDGGEDFHIFEEFWQMGSVAFQVEAKKDPSVWVEDIFKRENIPQALKDIVLKCYFD